MGIKDDQSAETPDQTKEQANINFGPNWDSETVPCVRTLYAGTLPSLC